MGNGSKKKHKKHKNRDKDRSHKRHRDDFVNDRFNDPLDRFHSNQQISLHSRCSLNENENFETTSMEYEFDCLENKTKIYQTFSHQTSKSISSSERNESINQEIDDDDDDNDNENEDYNDDGDDDEIVKERFDRRRLSHLDTSIDQNCDDLELKSENENENDIVAFNTVNLKNLQSSTVPNQPLKIVLKVNQKTSSSFSYRNNLNGSNPNLVIPSTSSSPSNLQDSESFDFVVGDDDDDDDHADADAGREQSKSFASIQNDSLEFEKNDQIHCWNDNHTDNINMESPKIANVSNEYRESIYDNDDGDNDDEHKDQSIGLDENKSPTILKLAHNDVDENFKERFPSSSMKIQLSESLRLSLKKLKKSKKSKHKKHHRHHHHHHRHHHHHHHCKKHQSNQNQNPIILEAKFNPPQSFRSSFDLKEENSIDASETLIFDDSKIDLFSGSQQKSHNEEDFDEEQQSIVVNNNNNNNNNNDDDDDEIDQVQQQLQQEGDNEEEEEEEDQKYFSQSNPFYTDDNLENPYLEKLTDVNEEEYLRFEKNTNDDDVGDDDDDDDHNEENQQDHSKHSESSIVQNESNELKNVNDSFELNPNDEIDDCSETNALNDPAQSSQCFRLKLSKLSDRSDQYQIPTITDDSYRSINSPKQSFSPQEESNIVEESSEIFDELSIDECDRNSTNEQSESVMFEKDFDPLSIPQPSSPSPSPASPPLSVSISNQKKAKKSQLQQLLFALFKQIQKKDPKKFFARPVSDQIAPGYFTIITHPMDLSTVKRKILDEYQCLNDFRLDIKLMCDNAMRYNRPDTIYYRTADRLWQYVANKLLKSTAISKYIKRYPNISVTELRIPSLECGTIDSNKIIESSRSDDDSKFLKPLDPINLFVTSNETLTDFGKTTSSILQQKPKSTLSQLNSSSRKNFDCKSQTKPHSNDYQSNIRSKSSQSSFSSMPSSSSSTSTSSSSSNESKLISIKTKSSVESFQLISSVSIENSSNTINSVSSRDVQHLTSNQSQQNKSHNQFLINVTKSNSHSNRIKSHENRNDLFGSRSNNDSCSLSSSTTSLSSLISSSTLDKSISNSTNLIDSNQIKSTNKNKSSHQDLNRKSTLKISKKICEEKIVNNQNVRNKIVPEERFDGYSLGAFFEQIQLAAQKAQENLRKSKRKAYLTYLKRTSEYLNPYLHTIDCQSISMYRQPLIKEFQWEEFFAKRNDCREILTEPISNHSTINANCLGFSNTNPISEVKENTTISKNDTKSVVEEKSIIEEEKKTAKMDEGEEKSDIFALETQELEQMREQLRSHYGSEDFGIDYASSILNFSRNSNYAESLTNSLLTILTDGEHRSKSTELQKYVERFFAYDFDQDDTLIDTKAIVSN